MNNIMRKYPRTLNEAFPSGTEYAASIERRRRIDWGGIWIVLIVATGIGAFVITSQTDFLWLIATTFF